MKYIILKRQIYRNGGLVGS